MGPKVFNGEIFDARCSDNWSFGMIVFQSMTVGQKLYSPKNMYKHSSGYWALKNDKLREYLIANKLFDYFGHDLFSLLNGLLNVNEQHRLRDADILHSKWFERYYQKYNKQITKKFIIQNQKLIEQRQTMNIYGFPFYK